MPTRTRPVTALLFAALAGCTPLPRVVPDLALRPARPVPVETARGPATPARGQRIIERLKPGGEPSSIFDRHLAIETALTGRPLVADNQVTLLENGTATYRAMLEAIAGARRHIEMETYILQDDEIGQRFADALIAKRRQGVRVHLLFDSVGTLDTPPGFFQRLKDAGITLLEYNPINPVEAKAGWDVNERDHRKQLLVDGEIALMGGINISGVYSGGSFKERQRKSGRRGAADAKALPWRDTDLRIEGPVVAEFQQIFLDTWTQQKGPPLPAEDFVPRRRAAQGRQVVRAIPSSPRDATSAIYQTLMSSIDHAEKEILITTAYFVPDPQLLDALARAAGRGVDVKLILPRHSDVPLVLGAGRAHYGALLRAGVKLHERRAVLLHAKTAVVDGVWSTVGSTNLDWRSFVHNQELNAVVLGTGFGAQMQAAFARDLAASDPVTLEAWEHRPVKQRLAEWLGQLLQYWL
ncbi:phospholipase D-like domain-containing protein [Ideonella sp.]|uniref:phospholipase D-like domain-containing protein n=1 Tax=Ideonella sp. TaxID=1929293 RepID=UPI002B467A88|nr:phospholipase D-like domain-containing protein [Ideonella sp.]HJV71999.1 phospholipase D-like domain-containing protein [Ideonella sp.]HSN31835.1 phospholipase D-like domain-containing protein [Ideonella sp.]